MKRSPEYDDGEYRINVRLPVDLGVALRAQAAHNCRSINNELIYLVKNGVKTAAEHQA